MTIGGSAQRILRRQGMPPQEIRAVLAADDPLVVRQLLELHHERLGEWLEEQRSLVANIERSLVMDLEQTSSRLEPVEVRASR